MMSRSDAFYSPVRRAVSQHLAVTCSGFLVKNPSLASNVNVSLHVGRSRDFIHETPRLLLAAGESVGNEISEAGNLRVYIHSRIFVRVGGRSSVLN